MKEIAHYVTYGSMRRQWSVTAQELQYDRRQPFVRTM